MKAVKVEYLIDEDGSPYFKASSEAGELDVYYRDYGLDAKDQALIVARSYCKRKDWPEPKGFGWLENDTWVATLELVI
jgi:hypothetical protein